MGCGVSKTGAEPTDAFWFGIVLGGVGGALQEINSIDNKQAELPTMHESRSCFMGLILLEALLALVVLLLIVWWTMFSGRTKGELVSKEADKSPQKETDDA